MTEKLRIKHCLGSCKDANCELRGKIKIGDCGTDCKLTERGCNNANCATVNSLETARLGLERGQKQPRWVREICLEGQAFLLDKLNGKGNGVIILTQSVKQTNADTNAHKSNGSSTASKPEVTIITEAVKVGI